MTFRCLADRQSANSAADTNRINTNCHLCFIDVDLHFHKESFVLVYLFVYKQIFLSKYIASVYSYTVANTP